MAVAVLVGVDVGVGVAVRVGVAVVVGVDVGVVVGVLVRVGVGVGVEVGVCVAVGVALGVFVDVGVGVRVGVAVGDAGITVNAYVRSSRLGGEARLRACTRTRMEPVVGIRAALAATKPLTLKAPLVLHGAAVASSHALSVSGSGAGAPLFWATSAAIELPSMPFTASATVNRITTGGEAVSPVSGLALKRNGIDCTSISPPPLRNPATMATSAGGLS